MIHPAGESSAAKLKWNIKFILFFVFGVIIACLNFFYVIVGYHKSAVKYTPGIYFKMGFFISVPLIIEHLVDLFIVKFFADKFQHNKRVDHFFGQGLIVCSLLAGTIEVALLTSEISSVTVFCIVGWAQCLAMCGILCKLQIGDPESFGPIISTFIAASFGASQMAITAVYVNCEKNDYSQCFSPTYIGVYCMWAVIGSIQFLFCSRRRLYAFFFEQVTVRQYSVCVLVCVALIFQFVRCIISFICLSRQSTTNLLETNVFLLCFLVLVAAILPGKMIRRSMTTLKDEMETKKTFIRYITHEVRSPLSTTNLALDYLIEQMGRNEVSYEEVLEVLKDAKSCCEVATNTLNDLLMLDKIETSMVEIAPEPVNAWAFAKSSVGQFRIQAHSHQLQLNAKLQPEPFHGHLQVNIDKHKMEQVVRNFMTNAIKFTPAGGSIAVRSSVRNVMVPSAKTLRSSISSTVPETKQVWFRLEVQDSGPGISQENLPKLFGQYVQFDAAKLQGGKGSGLGLWLSKSIVELHGGRIGATSEGEGKGCTFFFEIPAVMPEPDKVVEDTLRRQPSVYHERSVTINVSTAVRDGSPTGTPRDKDPSPQASPANTLPFPHSHSRFFQNSPSCSTKAEPKEPVTNSESPATSMRQVVQSVQELVSQYTSLVDKEKSSREVEFHDIENQQTSTSPQVSPKTTSPRQPSSFEFASPLPPMRMDRKLRILLVDDDLIARKMLERTVLSVTAVCHHASNGQDAVEMVRKSLAGDSEAYDVVVTDYYMPVMNGPEAVKLMREAGYRGTIIAATGTVSQSDIDLLKSSGANKVLQKPLQLKTIMRSMYGAAISCRALAT